MSQKVSTWPVVTIIGKRRSKIMIKFRENTDHVVILFPQRAISTESAPVAGSRKQSARASAVHRSGLGRGLSAIIHDMETPDDDRLFQNSGRDFSSASDDHS